MNFTKEWSMCDCSLTGGCYKCNPLLADFNIGFTETEDALTKQFKKYADPTVSIEEVRDILKDIDLTKMLKEVK